jgi:hypothetical protein
MPGRKPILSAAQRRALVAFARAEDFRYGVGTAAQRAAQAGELGIPAFTVEETTVRKIIAQARREDEIKAEPSREVYEEQRSSLFGRMKLAQTELLRAVDKDDLAAVKRKKREVQALGVAIRGWAATELLVSRRAVRASRIPVPDDSAPKRGFVDDLAATAKRDSASVEKVEKEDRGDVQQEENAEPESEDSNASAVLATAPG